MTLVKTKNHTKHPLDANQWQRLNQINDKNSTNWISIVLATNVEFSTSNTTSASTTNVKFSTTSGLATSVEFNTTNPSLSTTSVLVLI
jgi:hypothetical protein